MDNLHYMGKNGIYTLNIHMDQMQYDKCTAMVNSLEFANNLHAYSSSHVMCSKKRYKVY